MTIGEALKEEQDKLGLTEEKMVQGIMSKSAYSRVIHNERNISSKALVKILFKNGIDIITFFSKIEDTYLSESSNLEKKLSCAIGEAVNNHEVDKVKLYYRIIVNSDVSSYLKKRAKLAYYFLDNKMKYIDDDFKKSIIADLNDNDNWVLNVNVLRLFSSALIVLPHRNVEAEISFFLKKINRISNISDEMIERYATICDNYLHWKYDYCTKSKEKIKIDSNVQDALNYLKKLKSSAHNIIYIISFQYYLALFSNNIERAKEIKKELIDVGCNLVVKNWPV